MNQKEIDQLGYTNALMQYTDALLDAINEHPDGHLIKDDPRVKRKYEAFAREARRRARSKMNELKGKKVELTPPSEIIDKINSGEISGLVVIEED